MRKPTSEEMQRLTVEIWDAEFNTLAVVDAMEYNFLAQHAPWRDMMGDHETTLSPDIPSAERHREEMIRNKRPLLQDQLFTYSPV